MTALDAGVVGAGAAGLAAAWTLAEAGASVTVYERRSEPGGRMRTEHWSRDGAVSHVDAGVQLLASYFLETMRLSREADASELLVRSGGRDALWRGGRVHTVDFGSVASMAATRALPTRLKLRLAGRYARYLSRHASALDAAEPALSANAGLDRESIADWGARELGRDFVELLAYPLLGAAYGMTPERASAGFYHGLARAGMDVRLYAVRGGMAELPGAWARVLEARGGRLRYDTRVERVARADAGVRITLADAPDRWHDAVVVAVPAPHTKQLLRAPAALANWLDGVRTIPAVSVALLIRPPARADYFGLSLPRTEAPGERIVACCVQERKLDGLVPPGAGLVVVLPSPGFVPRLRDADVGRAIDELAPALETVFPGVRSRIRKAEIYHFDAGYTVFYPGYLAHLGRYDPAWLGGRVAVAGDFLVAPSVEGAVRSGVRAAVRLLRARPAGG